uniref:Cysteinyl-tRNA ligase anticodon binding domain-containing protein n=1 Tax=Alexandrium catenella TaxID=2925 RepID=A0A7S1REB0_ALECA|mmetsp:Transcript_52934/g.141774  ORF Transcript_52934/g.141774 Transcript_52934/m.141774 type:complete len:407 (+) Transcript_52934:96-1316(+)
MPYQAMTSSRDRSRSPAASGAYDEIVRLVVMREQARMSKDWATADSVREQLVAKGVTIQDKSSSWRCVDGSSGRIPTWSEVEGGSTTESFITNQSMTQGGRSAAMPPPVNDGSDAHIKHLVMMREQARAQKDFTQADTYREELKALGVDIFDKEKMWRSKTGASGVIIGYRGAGGPSDVEVAALVVQRERARQSNDYATSDMIRNELRAAGVEIHDREKMWRCNDGRQGPVPGWSAILAGGGDAAAVMPGMGAPGMAQSNANTLRNQVVQAALAAASDPNSAMQTLALLQQASGPGAAMPAKRAALPVGPVGPVSGPAGGSDPECMEALAYVQSCQATGQSPTDAELEWLVGLREKLRQKKEFADADTLRQALRSTFSLELDEKMKMWKCADGRQGAIPMWSAMGL